MVGTPEDFAFALFGLVVMRSAYWYRRLQPQIQFRRRVVLGHVLLCVSEVSFFFVSALATVVMFDHWRRSQFVFWKLMLLVAALFAFYCYKRQLASVGDALLETQHKNTGKPFVARRLGRTDTRDLSCFTFFPSSRLRHEAVEPIYSRRFAAAISTVRYKRTIRGGTTRRGRATTGGGG